MMVSPGPSADGEVLLRLNTEYLRASERSVQTALLNRMRMPARSMLR